MAITVKVMNSVAEKCADLHLWETIVLSDLEISGNIFN